MRFFTKKLAQLKGCFLIGVYALLAVMANIAIVVSALQPSISFASADASLQHAVETVPRAERIQADKPLVIIDASIADQPQLAAAIGLALNALQQPDKAQQAAALLAAQDYQAGQLLDLEAAQVYILQPQRDAIAQVSALLAGYRNLPALHYFSHASAGQLQLGALSLNAANFNAYQSELAGWRDSLAQHADVLFYGCELARDQAGKALVDRLAQTLQVQVSASIDITGAPAKGGNWDLEYKSAFEQSTSRAVAALRAITYQGRLVVGGTGADDDFDGDGVLNKNDLDEDNDGVLSQQEVSCRNGTLSAPFTNLSQVHSVATSGRYYFDPDNNGSNLFQADVDSSNGGGWVLALQYAHKGTTNPTLTVISANANLPISSNAALGTDESADATRWGHGGTATMAQFSDINEIRFYGITSGHSRVLHFKTPLGVSHIRTGIGTFAGISSNHTLLSGHTANLPSQTDSSYSNQGNKALTEHSFYKSNSNHWNIKGLDSRWEVDDYPSNFSQSTIHKVWVRSTSSIACISIHSDGDNVANHFDLDSDNDGISDLLEAGSVTVSTIDALAASYPQGKYTGAVNAQGVPTAANGGAGYTRGSGINLDSDSDGIPDALEVQPTVGYASVNEASVNFEGITNNGSGLFSPQDSDGDDTPDFLDLNSDDDAESDDVETLNTITPSYAATDGNVNAGSLTNVDNPSNAEVDYRKAPMAANNDSASSINGLAGQNNVINVLSNDIYNGVAASTSTVFINQSSTTITLVPAGGDAADITLSNSGAINVAAMTTSGNYQLSYWMCANSNANNCDSATVALGVAESPSITLDKIAGSPSSNSAGGIIRYTFTVSNTGNAVLNTLQVFDAKLNQTLTISGSLNPGQSTLTAANYTLTQEDVNAGQVLNTATVTALSPNSTQVSANDTALSSISSSPAINLDKVAGTPSGNTAGSTIAYTFTVANSGNVTLNNMQIFDAKLNQTLTISGSLNPGQSTSTAANYTLTQADVNAGQVVNTATVTALAPNSTQVSANDTALSSISSSPAISLDKVAGTPSGNVAGSTIRYTFTVANSGNVTLNNMQIFDAKLNQTLTISGSLNPGQSTSTAANYTLTQEDINAGQVLNTATVTGLSPNSTQVSAGDSALSSISSSPAISLDKVAGTPSGNVAGSTIRYTFTVANSGNVTLNTLQVFDAKMNQTLSISGSLNPGQSTSTAANYTLTQEDINAGQVVNTATVTALAPNSNQVSANDTALATISSSPAINLDKVAGTPSGNTAGSTIRYTFTVSNSGNVTLNNMQVFDAKLNQTLTISGSLNPGQSTLTAANYTLTQADINAGQVLNTATVTALSPNSTQVSAGDSALSSISSSPAISLDKVAGTPSGNVAGSTIRYTFTVANSGNVTLNNMQIFDVKMNQTLSISGSLNPGQSTSTAANYTLTQADVNAGQVVNTATVTALSPNSTQVSANDTALATISSSPAISLDKVAGTPSGNVAGSTIRYTFTVTNSGNVTLNTLQIFDAKLNQTLTISGSLNPGQSTSTAANYTLTQEDINAGQVVNTATVTALAPNSTQVSATDSAISSISSSPAISLDKVAGTPSGNVAGSTIRYTFTVANSGNVTLNNMQIFDAKMNQTFSISGSLNPGQSTSTAANYTLTQADINAGQVLNTATVTALSPNSTQVSANDTALSSISSSPAISLDKVAGTPSGNIAGSTIRYTFTVANSGNVTLNTLQVFDAKLNQTLTISGSLNPGQSTSTAANYTLTQEDVNAGQVLNTATVTALSPNSTQVSANDTALSSISSSPAINLDKVAGTPSGSVAGSTIRYTFTVANSGNVTLNTLQIFDAKLNQTFSISGSLNPGQSTLTAANYSLTQEDINAGQVVNTATVTALAPNSNQVSANDSAISSISSSPAISLDKVAGTPSGNTVGSTIRYTFTVSNSGNVTLNDMQIFDAKMNQTFSISGSLNPGQSTSTAANYTLTQEDINAGQVINTATVTALAPNSTQVSANASAVVSSISSSPAITLDKVAGTPSGNVAGSTIRYTFTVANSGNVTLNDMQIFDAKMNQTLTISGSLNPGQSTSTAANYTLTQEDINAGQVVNTATVTALAPNSNQVSANDSAISSISSSPAINLDKVAGTPSGNTVGSTIRYTFTVANSGNVTLNNMQVFDAKMNQTLTISGSLNPGQSTLTAANYTLTQADVNAGQVVNTATVTGLSPNNTQVSANDTALATISSSPAISLDKVAGTPSGNTVGSTIRYTFTVANSGNVTLNNMQVFDAKMNQTLSISGSLNPGQSTSTAANYTLTQEDINAGQVINTATVTALAPNSTQVSANASAVVSSISSSPAISLDKVAGTPSGNTVGSTIRYTFTVANSGNVTLNTLQIFDAKMNQTLSISGSLNPGQSTSTAANYTLTQEDINAGQVVNTATVTALSPNSNQVSANDTALATISSSPAISLDKVAGTPSGNIAGSSIRYTFTVANSGNVTLNTLQIFDAKMNQTLTISGSLNPGQSTSTAANYTLTQEDVNAGQVVNTATVTALSPSGAQVSANDTALSSISSNPGISFDKAASAPSKHATGGIIHYTFTVSNSGNVTLNDMQIFDAKLNQTFSISGSLNPGQSTSTTASYTLTLADSIEGKVINTATVTASLDNGTQLSASDSVTTQVNSKVSISGTIWLDEDNDGQLNGTEHGTGGYTINLYEEDPNNPDTQGPLLASSISDSEGRYRFIDLDVNKNYSIEVRDSNGTLIESFALSVDQIYEGATVDLPLPIDPSGVIYDSISLQPLVGALVNLRRKSNGALYPDNCLTGVKRQGQVTTADGRYEFFINAADAACVSATEVLTIEVIPPLGYSASVNIPVRTGTVNQGDCTVGGSSVDAVSGTLVCEIQAQDSAPASTATTATAYYLDFIVPNSSARDVIHNHIPLDPPRPLGHPDTYTVSVGSVVTASVVANDEINPYPAANPYTVQIVTGTVSDPNGGTLTLASNGLMRYEAPASAVSPITFSYRVTQNDGKTIQTQVRIQVVGLTKVFFDLNKKVNKTAVSIGDVVRYSIEVQPRAGYTQTSTVTLVDRLPAGVSWVEDTLGLVTMSGHGVRGAAVALSDANIHSAAGRIEVSWVAAPGVRYELVYFARINAGATQGEKINRAQLLNAQGEALSGVTQVAIEIEEDPILDKLTVIGKVFNDVNQNGVQDEALDELGMQGVRVISLSGQIISTDAYGRFSIPAVSAGSYDRGRNYLLKVDGSSLPPGYVFSTENPQVVRITPGLLTRINFGVYKPARVNLDEAYERCIEQRTDTMPQCMRETQLAQPADSATGVNVVYFELEE